jgi:hypothetical protein
VATVNLSFLNRRTINKQVCRICQEFTELKHERLCGECTRVFRRWPHAAVQARATRRG